MWEQFLLENVHFAVNLFTALVFFAAFWLYADAWIERKPRRDLPKLAGFALLTVSFIAQAVVMETSIVPLPLIRSVSISEITAWLRILGYLLLMIGLMTDPLEKEPGVVSTGVFILPVAGLAGMFPLSQVILAAGIAILYMRRATIGLEDHLKPLSITFGLLSIVELCEMRALFGQVSSVGLYSFVAPFGPVWLAGHVVLIITAVVLCRWVFGYLLKQFQAQLFMVYTATIVAVFLGTTVSFTGLLLRNMEQSTIRQIETDVKVLEYTVRNQKDIHIADSRTIAQNPEFIQFLIKNDRKALGDFATAQLITKNLSTFLVLSESGQVIARGEDRDRIGDIQKQDSFVRRGLLGESIATVLARDGVLAPEISLRAISPVRNETGGIIGAVIVGKAVDTAFVDGLKKATGLDASIYGDAIISATTFETPDGTARLIGMREEHVDVKKRVLREGLLYSGSLPIRETVYTSAFLPLKDVDGNPVGMLYVGRPQNAILRAAGESIQYTFIITAILLVASVFPAYAISKYIASQL